MDALRSAPLPVATAVTQNARMRQSCMAQDFVMALYRWFLSAAVVVRDLLPILLIACVSLAVLWLALKRLAPQEAASLGAAAKRAAARTARIPALVLVLLLFCGSLVTARGMVQTRRGTVLQAQASHRNDPQLSGIVQYAPAIALMQEKTYTRTITLPPDFVTRIGADGLQVLSPYLSDPSAEGVEKLVDNFKKSGQNVVFTRELTRMDQVPVPADSADVRVGFDTHATHSGQRFYEAEFNGTYSFKNPGSSAANMRFVFPLPQGGGTVQGFYFDLAGKHITEPDDHGQYSWTGSMQPGATLQVHAHYHVTGAGAYDYLLGSESRRIGNFHFVASGADSLQFGKSGIYPTSLSDSTADWQLQDVLTAQSIALVFPRADLQVQLLDKTLTLLPLILVAFAVCAFFMADERAFVGTSLFGVGLLAVPVLSSYLLPQVATFVGIAIAFLSGGLALGKASGWLLSLACGLLGVAFLTVEHGALLAWIVLALVAMTMLLRKSWRTALTTAVAA